MVKQSSLTPIFTALSHPIRRDIVERLITRPRTVETIARRYSVSLPAVSRHLGVLEKSGLIERKKKGRFVVCHASPAALAKADAWFKDHEEFWASQLRSLETHLQIKKKKT
jgi:DNA-binding transcriptional ArsR family regulator